MVRSMRSFMTMPVPTLIEDQRPFMTPPKLFGAADGAADAAELLPGPANILMPE